MESLQISICVPFTATRIHRTETMLARRFSELGHHVDVVVFEVAEVSRPRRAYQVHDGIRFFFLRGARLAESIYVPLERKASLDLDRPDVVHVTEDTQSVTYWAAGFARREGLPLCVSTNRDQPPGHVGRRALYAAAERLFGRRVREDAQGFSVHTPGQLEYLRKRGLQREDVFIIPNMVNTEHFRPTSERSREECMRYAGAGFSFLSIGRLAPNKGYSGLLRAFAHVVGERPDARLTIIGRGPQETELRRLIRLLGLDRCVLLYTGFVQNSELAFVYPHFDAYVQPSLVEPFGIAVLEAMASGLPVVASAAGGMRYSVVNEETGLLVPPEEEAKLSQALLRMGDERFRVIMGSHALARVREHYDWKHVADEYLRLYAHGLSKPGPWRLAFPRTARGASWRPLRVAIGVATLGIGRGRSEIALSQFLQGRGHRPLVVTCRIEGNPDKTPGWHEVEGVPVLVLPSLRIGNGIFLPTGKRKALKREWIDLFHATEDSQGVTWWAARAAKATGRPLAVSTERSEPPSTLLARIAYVGAELAFARRVRREADAFAARSDAVLGWLRRRRGYVPRETSKIPNAVDAKCFRPDRTRTELWGRDGHPSVLSIGRLVENKDYATLIDAMAKVRQKFPRASATIIGRGPLEVELEARIAAQGMEGLVRLEKAYIPDDLFPGVYPGFDIYAQPSRVEPMALASLEALSSGLPVVASAVGGMTEVVQEGTNGYLVPPGDAGALADAIERGVEPVERARLSEGARRTVIEQFDWDVVGPKWIEFYQRALNARRPESPPGLAPSSEGAPT